MSAADGPARGAPPPGEASSPLRGGVLVLVALGLWNLGNYAFFLLAGRLLGPAEYGLVAALLAATLVVAVPTQALQFAVARLVAAPPGGDPRRAEGILRHAWRTCARVTPLAALAAAAAAVAADRLDPALPLGPILATIAVVLPLGFFFLALGDLQGRERFGAFATAFALWGLPRPVALVPLAAAGLGVYAALGATAVAVLAALAAALLAARPRPPAIAPDAAATRAFARPLVPVAVGLAGLGVLTNLDVIVAKLSLGAEQAGTFAAAATLAKAVFLVPQAVSFVLLPRVAARSAVRGDTGLLLGVGVAVTLVAGGLASLVIWALAEPVLRLTYGEEFTGSAGLLGLYAGASTLIGALIVVINHHIGRGSVRFAWVVAGLAVLQAVLFAAFHGTPEAIVAVDAAVGLAGLALHEAVFAGTDDAILAGLRRAAVRLRGRGGPA